MMIINVFKTDTRELVATINVEGNSIVSDGYSIEIADEDSTIFETDGERLFTVNKD